MVEYFFCRGFKIPSFFPFSLNISATRLGVVFTLRWLLDHSTQDCFFGGVFLVSRMYCSPPPTYSKKKTKKKELMSSFILILFYFGFTGCDAFFPFFSQNKKVWDDMYWYNGKGKKN